MVPFGQGDLGNIVGGTRRYQLTWDDLLWAARMVMGEAGSGAGGVHGAAVLWCMASRFAVARGFQSYTSLIKAYSQPINPKWAADGDFCRVGGRNHGTSDCSSDRLERRARHQTITWEEIPETVQSLVFRWATAQVQNPIPKAVHFAVPAVVARRGGGYVNRTGPDSGWDFVWDSTGRQNIDPRARNGNCFVSTNASREWNQDHVKIRFHRKQASDSGVTEVEEYVRPLGTSGSETETSPSAFTQRVPGNDSFERQSLLTSDRTGPPNIQYGYFHAFNDKRVVDQQAQAMLNEEQTDTLLKIHNTRFYDQVTALRSRSNLEMTQMVSVLMILAEDEDGNVENLNETIFSQSPLHGYQDDFQVFPDRPLASLLGFEVVVQEPSVGGVTGISMGTLSLKIHNPEMVTRQHPKGKFLAYLMSQGYVIRVRYGIEGANAADQGSLEAFQWKEEDFFITQYNCTINNDNTMSLRVSVMPATHRLLNQMKIGESLPVEQIGRLTEADIENAINTVVGSERVAPNSEGRIQNDQDRTAEINEMRRLLRTFQAQFNSPHLSPGMRLESRGEGTFGSVLHAALSNSHIFQQEEGIQSVPVTDMVTALQTIQSTLLTRRFQQLILNDCYRATHRGVTFSAINIGPLLFNLVKPEVDASVGFVSRNQIEIGEKFSVDYREREQLGNTRRNVKLIFGLFNSRAGKWANQPISMFPINAETIFSHIRQCRGVGEFSSTVNAFINQLRTSVNEISNFDADTSSGSEKIRLRIETPQIRYVIYPDPTPDSTDWIMYVYDNKVPLVSFRDAVDAMMETSVRNASRPDGTQDKLQAPSKADIKEILVQQKIPWIEMAEEGSFIKSFSAETASDDLLGSHNMVLGNRSQQTARDFDGARDVPAGISRDWFGGTQGTARQGIRNVSYVAPIRVSVQSFVLPTAYYLGPIFVFFPIRTFSGIYFIQEVRHDIKNQGSVTNLNLQINLSVYNQIAL